MLSNRRSFIAGLTGATALAGFSATPALANTATRRFDALLGRNKVGETSVTLSRSGGRVIVDIDARLRVSILGIINFNYHLSNRETWRNGVLQELRSTTDNDGKPEFVIGHRVGNGFQIDASGFQGVVPGNPATTSYFTSEFMQRPTWISTQSGKPLNLAIANRGNEGFATSDGNLACTKYSTSGGLDINLFYDSNDEWVGSNFRVAGRNANIRMSSRGQSFNALWR